MPRRWESPGLPFIALLERPHSYNSSHGEVPELAERA